VSDPIRIRGLREFQRGLRELDKGLPKSLRLALNDAANVIVDDARPQVPRRSGRAAGSIKARSTRTLARVVGGGSRAPYYPWLDFGGRVGRNRSVRRPFLKEGRYIYASYDRRKSEFGEKLEANLLGVARKAGLGVD